jgi:uncharacterized protein (TIGR00251 family)
MTGVSPIAALEFDVHVRPGTKRNSVGGVHGELLVVRTTAPPVDGRANDAVESALAEAFGVRPSTVSIVRGATARRKRVRIVGDRDVLVARLDALRETTAP